jgi:hypothetical protein
MFLKNLNVLSFEKNCGASFYVCTAFVHCTGTHTAACESYFFLLRHFPLQLLFPKRDWLFHWFIATLLVPRALYEMDSLVLLYSAEKSLAEPVNQPGLEICHVFV